MMECLWGDNLFNTHSWTQTAEYEGKNLERAFSQFILDSTVNIFDASIKGKIADLIVMAALLMRMVGKPKPSSRRTASVAFAKSIGSSPSATKLGESLSRVTHYGYSWATNP